MATNGRIVPQPRPQWQITEDYIDSLMGKEGHSRHNLYSLSRSYDNEALDLLKHHLRLHDSLKEARTQLQAISGHADTRAIDQQLQGAAQGANEIRLYINRKVRGHVLVHLPSNESTVLAQKVFGTAELAEMILTNLTPEDLIRAMQCSKTLATSIASSPRLQMKLFLRVNPNSLWTTFFDEYGSGSGVRCSIQRDTRPFNGRQGEVEVEVNISLTRHYDRYEREPADSILPEERMLICQPPIYQMTAIPNCCRFYIRKPSWQQNIPGQPPGPRAIESQSGLTVENLLEFAEEIGKDHLHCPFANESDHNAVGEVRVGVYLVGSLMLHPNDPAIPHYYDDDPSPGSPDMWGEEMERRRNRPTEKERFFDAKQEALINGWEPLTFQQWREQEQQKQTELDSLHEESDSSDDGEEGEASSDDQLSDSQSLG